jgi:hypothetical protein
MDLAYSVAARRLRTYARGFTDKNNRARGFIDKIIEDDFDRGDMLSNVFLFAHGLSRVLTSMR